MPLGRRQDGQVTLEYVGALLTAVVLVLSVALVAIPNRVTCSLNRAVRSMFSSASGGSCGEPEPTALRARTLSETGTDQAKAPVARTKSAGGRSEKASWWCVLTPWLCLPDIDPSPRPISFAPVQPFPALMLPEACPAGTGETQVCLAELDVPVTERADSRVVPLTDALTLQLDPSARTGPITGFGPVSAAGLQPGFLTYDAAVRWCDSDLVACTAQVRAAATTLTNDVQALLGVPPDCFTPASGRRLQALTARQITIARYTASTGLAAVAVTSGVALGQSGHPFLGVLTGMAVSGLGLATNLWLDARTTQGQPGLTGQELVAVRQGLVAGGAIVDQLDGQGEMIRNVMQVMGDWAAGHQLAADQLQHGGAGQQLDAAQGAVADIENQAAALAASGSSDSLSCAGASSSLATATLLDQAAERSAAVGP